MDVGTKGTMTFGDGTNAKVEIVDKNTYSTMPTDYWFSYQEGESNKQIIHPDFKEKFPLPEGLVDLVFKED